jgi:L-fuculose-phosphate aldolase
MIDVGRRMYEHGLLAGTSGNISVRLAPDRFLITGSGVAKGRLTEGDFAVVDSSGKQLDGEGRPSSEMRMHLFAFERRPEIMACLHAHPLYATAHAVAGKTLQIEAVPEVVAYIGPIPLTDYAPPGTGAVPESLAPFIADHHAFLLRSHGVLTLGRSLEEAYNRLETVEHCAHLLYLAEALGGAEPIPASDLRRLEQIRKAMLGSDADRKR